jgi:ABC-type hemin transport system ATPase subunit
MNLALTRREAALPAAPEVIVMCADDDGLVLQFRIRAFEEADDVMSRAFAARDINRDAERNIRKIGGGEQGR